MKLIPVILCGGAGSRLWPVSREQHPKPLIRIDGEISLLQKAFIRAGMLPDVNEVITVTNRDLYFKIEDEYEEVSSLIDKEIRTDFILEPFGRNTAPAITAASIQALEDYGDEVILLVLAADHLISKQKEFEDAVQKGCELARRGKIVTFGIYPVVPETGYGYIEADGYDVVRFIEKPDLEKAKRYVESGDFLWNSGIFCFSASSILNEIQKYTPDAYAELKECLCRSKKSVGVNFSHTELNPEYFKSIKSDSIDYSVMEKTNNAAVVPCDIGWSDIGCWRSLGDLKSADFNSNRINGDVVVIDSSDCTVDSEDRIVGIVGVENLIVIDTADALLVADKGRAQEVKKIYTQLKEQGHEAHRLHKKVYRPWGTYTVLEEGENFKIKRIEVKAGACLSLQMHHKRSEHWVVVKGEANVLNGDQHMVIRTNESTYIPAGQNHRLCNPGNEQCILIEVQSGEYVGEDDIVRFEDCYGRA